MHPCRLAARTLLEIHICRSAVWLVAVQVLQLLEAQVVLEVQVLEVQVLEVQVLEVQVLEVQVLEAQVQPAILRWRWPRHNAVSIRRPAVARTAAQGRCLMSPRFLARSRPIGVRGLVRVSRASDLSVSGPTRISG